MWPVGNTMGLTCVQESRAMARRVHVLWNLALGVQRLHASVSFLPKTKRKYNFAHLENLLICVREEVLRLRGGTSPEAFVLNFLWRRVLGAVLTLTKLSLCTQARHPLISQAILLCHTSYFSMHENNTLCVSPVCSCSLTRGSKLQ